MALLTLKDIGKIYVSDNNVTVGIRGVNLSFDRGEFVAVTGKSGSGKSTLLNVISGMDSYEEGELYIEDQPTSHFLQSDWEEYREKYISFIFQEYNIIESYTVLQNVELSLMHITNGVERRKKALELLDRVGLSKFIHHKGSKLSGGQKQRTVIARALAKDSPIILADEPTGNLDSKTSTEIINLLREVSKEKLVIVVTHNFEQVEHCATRHIRVFDGAIESDHVINNSQKEALKNLGEIPPTNKKNEFLNGLTLGKAIFTATPKLTTFIIFLLLVGVLATAVITSLCSEAGELFADSYMFNNIPGRVIVTHRNGSVLTDDELKELQNTYGADYYLHYDKLLDVNYGTYLYFSDVFQSTVVKYSNQMIKGEPDVGTFPKEKYEVLLHLPIYLQPYFGTTELLQNEIQLDNFYYKITGVKYYYDNTKDAEAMFTPEGFKFASALNSIFNNGRQTVNLVINLTTKNDLNNSQSFVYYSYDMKVSPLLTGETICITDKYYNSVVNDLINNGFPYAEMGITGLLTSTFDSYNYDGNYYYDYDKPIYGESKTYSIDINKENIVKNVQGIDVNENDSYSKPSVYISPDLITKISEQYFNDSYRQSSLFFSSNYRAREVAKQMTGEKYIAVSADTTYQPEIYETIENTIFASLYAVLWLVTILFIAFFINLCTQRAIGAFKSDMAIMRSMGITVKTIKIGIYSRMIYSLIPAYLISAIVFYFIYTNSKTNGIFPFLHITEYLCIAIGMILISLRVTYKQVYKLFNESVKKALKGGAAE